MLQLKQFCLDGTRHFEEYRNSVSLNTNLWNNILAYLHWHTLFYSFLPSAFVGRLKQRESLETESLHQLNLSFKAGFNTGKEMRRHHLQYIDKAREKWWNILYHYWVFHTCWNWRRGIYSLIVSLKSAYLLLCHELIHGAPLIFFWPWNRVETASVLRPGMETLLHEAVKMITTLWASLE